MIKSNELRIGNYIEINQYPNDRCIIQIEKGNDIDACFKLNSTPIPLTEEWLLKFGFEEYMSANDLRISIYAGVLLQFHFGVNQLECWIGDEISRTDILYVHQLQNLYFALTNEELTIK